MGIQENQDNFFGKKVYIIAEAGVNHNGSLEKAKELIDIASWAGADAVKFQTFKAEKLASKKAVKANYQLGDKEDSQYNMLKKLELSNSDHLELINYCNKKKIKFFSTAFDLEGLDYLYSLGFDFFKIPSGEITNLPYLEKISSYGKPVILSTGMSTLKEVEDAINILNFNLSRDLITVLHCNTEYPTPFEDVNLHAMTEIGDKMGVAIGYSDHTLGIEIPVSAVTLGASIIEKHFTISRGLNGPDHSASLEPKELKLMVQSIRNVEKALSGPGKKIPSKSEFKNRNVVRKSIHIANALKKGQIIEERNLIALRPGDGISPMNWKSVIGKVVNKDLESFHKLNRSDFL